VAWSKYALVGWQQVGGLQESMTWRTTRRSRSFDNTGRFEIGRYDETLGFFALGMMNAFLKPAGK